MFDAVRNNRKIVQLILAAIILSFAFFGIESYLRDSGGGGEVATVAGTKITGSEFERALQQQQERIRAESSEPIDEKLFQSTEFKSGVLKNLIDRSLILINVGKFGLIANDRQVQETIGAIPAFQRDGRFNPAQYDQILRIQGLNQAVFEASVRQDLASQQFVTALTEGGVASKASVKLLLTAQGEKRVVSYYRIPAKSFGRDDDVSDGEIQKFYEKNGGVFERPARLRAEYIVLDPQSIENSIAVSEQEAQKWYEEHKQRYSTPEERRASHILLQVEANATDDQILNVRRSADEILAKVKADPKSFEAIAREKSQDSESASQGGDLGYFGRGSMVKGFDDAVFGISQSGDFAGPIRTEFGFHVIKLTGIRPSKAKEFSDIKLDIFLELRKIAISRKYGEAAEGFSNLVYENPDSLGAAAAQFKLKVETSDWIESGSERIGSFKSSRLIQALFSHDALRSRRNTEATDVGGGVLIAARVLEYEPARRLSIGEARHKIVSAIRVEKRKAEVAKEGQRILSILENGGGLSEGEFSAPEAIRRNQIFDNNSEVTQQIFSLSGSSLPRYIGHQGGNGDYLIVKFEKVTTDLFDKGSSIEGMLRSQYQKILGKSALDGILIELKDRFGVKSGSLEVFKK